MKRLILIDGLPGTGKSTLAQALAETRLKVGKAVSVHYETDQPHPLHPISTDAMGAAWANIHELLTAEDFSEMSLSKWKVFVESLEPDSTSIIESIPFQSTVRVLYQMNAPRSLIDQYWLDWQWLLRDTSSTVIFHRAENACALINQISTRRGAEWKEYLQAAVQEMPISRTNNWSGWMAVEHFLTTYSTLMDTLLADASVPVLALDGAPLDYGVRLQTAVRSIGFAQVSNHSHPTR